MEHAPAVRFYTHRSYVYTPFFSFGNRLERRLANYYCSLPNGQWLRSSMPGTRDAPRPHVAQFFNKKEKNRPLFRDTDKTLAIYTFSTPKCLHFFLFSIISNANLLKFGMMMDGSCYQEGESHMSPPQSNDTRYAAVPTTTSQPAYISSIKKKKKKKLCWTRRNSIHPLDL